MQAGSSAKDKGNTLLQLSILLVNGDSFGIEIGKGDTIAGAHEAIAKEKGILPYTFRLFVDGNEKPLGRHMLVSELSTDTLALIVTVVPSTMRLNDTVALGGLRVRKKPSLSANQVGSIEWSNPLFEVLQVENGWAKLAPCEYSRLKESFKFQPHDAYEEGWCIIKIGEQTMFKEVTTDS